MKKLIHLFCVLALFACSDESTDSNNNENNDNGDNSTMLVSKINTTSIKNDLIDEDYAYEDSYTYDGNKIVETNTKVYYNGQLHNTRRKEYIYTDNKISRIDSYDSENQLTLYQALEYDSQGRVVLFESFYCESQDNCELSLFSTLTYSSNTISLFHSFDSSTNTAVAVLDNSGNMVSASSTDEDDEGCGSSTTVEYDNQNNAFKNITGFNNLGPAFADLIYPSAQYYGYYGLNNNPTREVNTTACNGGDEYTYTYNFYYDYNDEGYPRNIIEEEVGPTITLAATTIIEYQ